MSSFSERLYKLRKKNNLSQDYLANKIGVSRSTISNYELNKRLPSVEILNIIADYFQVSTDYLLGRSNIPINLKEYLSQDSPDIFLLIDPETGRIIKHNQSAVSFYGYSVEQFKNKTIYDISTHSNDKIKNIMKKLKSAEEEQYELYFKHRLANSEIKDVKLTTTTLNSNGKTIIATTIKDISSCKKNQSTLKNILHSLTSSWGRTVFYNVPFKKSHSDNVSNLAFEIGKQLSLTSIKLDSLKIAGLLHDIGEHSIPESILNKPKNLSKNEFNLIKEHPQKGYQIIKDIPFEEPIADIILQHHERLDGSGYPKGLTSNNILLEAKIIMVADVIEAMSSDRPHRKSYDLNYILKKMRELSNIKYDKKIVDICIYLLKNNLFAFK